MSDNLSAAGIIAALAAGIVGGFEGGFFEIWFAERHNRRRERVEMTGLVVNWDRRGAFGPSLLVEQREIGPDKPSSTVQVRCPSVAFAESGDIM